MKRIRPVLPALGLVVALGVGAGGVAARQDAEGGPEPGRLVGASLEAEFLEDGAFVQVVLELDEAEGWSALPLRVLAFGGTPRDVRARVEGRGPDWPLGLQEVRRGLWEGSVPLESSDSSVVRLHLSYRVPGALRRDGGEAPSAAVMAVPWLLVPWAPEDGAPDRVRMSLTFPSAVELSAPFPAGLRAEPTGSGTGSREWRANLPVLPSMARAGVRGAPDAIVDAGSVSPGFTGPGAPPDVPRPGFVFGGLFLAFGAVTLGYLAWMMSRARRS
jgi:hypothetical protein